MYTQQATIVQAVCKGVKQEQKPEKKAPKILANRFPARAVAIGLCIGANVGAVWPLGVCIALGGYPGMPPGEGIPGLAGGMLHVLHLDCLCCSPHFPQAAGSMVPLPTSPAYTSFLASIPSRCS
jgi:hypothetical protein